MRLCSTGSGSGGGDEWWGDNADPGKLFDDEVDEETDSKRTKNKPSDTFTRRPSSSNFTAAPVRRIPIVTETSPKLSMAQALYLAKEAGVFTTREVQTHIIKSPSFSTNDSPFLLENFFASQEDGTSDPFSADVTLLKQKLAESATANRTAGFDAQTTSKKEDTATTADVVPEKIHQILSSISGNVPTFGARGREWKVRAEGKGTRKRATAHVVIQRGSGIVKVNGEEDFYKRFPLLYNRFDVLYPMEACKASGLFDVFIAVKGGGISGQAGAARLALGRALVSACTHCEDDLKDTLVLFEDTRQRTSKFAGKKGAYARHNWTLR